ncbi:isocitrate lyase/phosphoenolpyruvate mutase family protein [Sphingobacterium sp. SRCM116780]|uniref:isocitrate lyase/PEP mutase family protein n=1 Tax=Sphingobacterium sp. SRCM116780 TaxID=2907623 RepID=UPI001F2CD875|nr:isocitrate lyase/phosphoenolpyruvate mutase family protein [Sphingobacterium sp. SRCM116780]UIR57880.1 isocitrate lyase/phosphoenolpyruvate mutase family protein [Sphingobacterium sp. SRCM116780]
MKSQYDKAVIFSELHKEKSAFIMPNPWDIGSAKILSSYGFKALATSGAAFALSNGADDNSLALEKVLVHLRELTSATDLPVSADLGYGFFDSPKNIYDTILRAAETGIVGASIEDTNSNKNYPFELAVERVKAASEAAKSLNFPFILTARADNYFIGNPDLDDTIKRLQAYQRAGADVLFAPGIILKEEIESVISSIDKPLNVFMGLKGGTLSFEELSKIGVRRISLGASLYRNAMSSFIKSIQHIKSGQFDFANDSLSFQEINTLIQK